MSIFDLTSTGEEAPLSEPYNSISVGGDFEATTQGQRADVPQLSGPAPLALPPLRLNAAKAKRPDGGSGQRAAADGHRRRQGERRGQAAAAALAPGDKDWKEALRNVDSLEQVVQVPSADFNNHLKTEVLICGMLVPSRTAEIKAQGLMLIRGYARVHPLVVASRGLLDHLIDHLFSGHRLLRPCAAAGIAALASQRAGRDVLLRQPRVLRRLLEMMRLGGELDASNAALAVANWALHPLCKEWIGAFGGVPILIKLLRQAIREPTEAEVAALKLRSGDGGDSDDDDEADGRRRGTDVMSPRALLARQLSKLSKASSQAPRRSISPFEAPQLPVLPLDAQRHIQSRRTLRASKSHMSEDSSSGQHSSSGGEQIQLIDPRPSAVHAASALLNLVDLPENRQQMLEAGVTEVINSVLKFPRVHPRAHMLAERCGLISSWLGLTDVKRALNAAASSGGIGLPSIWSRRSSCNTIGGVGSHTLKQMVAGLQSIVHREERQRVAAAMQRGSMPGTGSGPSAAVGTRSISVLGTASRAHHKALDMLGSEMEEAEFGREAAALAAGISLMTRQQQPSQQQQQQQQQQGTPQQQQQLQAPQLSQPSQRQRRPQSGVGSVRSFKP